MSRLIATVVAVIMMGGQFSTSTSLDVFKLNGKEELITIEDDDDEDEPDENPLVQLSVDDEKFTIVVLAWKRFNSLQRLLNSLLLANYDGNKIG